MFTFCSCCSKTSHDVAHAGLELKKPACFCLWECWQQRHTPEPPAVSTLFRGHTLSSSVLRLHSPPRRSQRLSLHSQCTAREKANQLSTWGWMKSLFFRTFQRHRGTTQNRAGTNFTLRKVNSVTPAPDSHHCKATPVRSKVHLRGPRAALAFTPTRTESRLLSCARPDRSAGLGFDSDFSAKARSSLQP